MPLYLKMSENIYQTTIYVIEGDTVQIAYK